MSVPHDIRLSFRDPAVKKTDHPRAVIEPARQCTDLFGHRLRPMAA